MSKNNGNFHHTHLALYSHIYLSGCSQFKQVETRSNQLDLVVVHMKEKGIAWLVMHFCFGLQQEKLCKTDLSGLKLSVSITNPCSKLLCTEVRESFSKQTLYI